VSAAKGVRLVVAVAAAAAAATVVGVVYATRQAPPHIGAQCTSRPQPLIVPGVPSPNVAAVRAAFALRPQAASRRLEPLAQQAPSDPVVQFNFGTALFCAGYVTDAADAWRAAKKAGRDTYYEMKADVILHPQFFAPADGLYPVFETQRADPLLLQGITLQRQGHQHSAERVYARAARLRSRASTRTTSPRRSLISGPWSRASRRASRSASTSGSCSRGRASARRPKRSSVSHARWAPERGSDGKQTPSSAVL